MERPSWVTWERSTCFLAVELGFCLTLWNSSQIDDIPGEAAGLGGEVLVSEDMERVVFNNQSLNIKFCLLIPMLFFATSNS